MHIREYLLERGMPASIFAEWLGISRPMFQNIVNGKKKVTIDIALKIVELTNGEVSLQDLCKGPTRPFFKYRRNTHFEHPQASLRKVQGAEPTD